MSERSLTQRFIRSAWALVSFQLVAAVGAVGVTGWAAFSVNNMAQRYAQMSAGYAPPAAEAVESADGAAPATEPMPSEVAPADGVTATATEDGSTTPAPAPEAAPASNPFQICMDMTSYSACAACVNETAAALGVAPPNLGICPG